MQKICIDLGYGYTKGLADNGRSIIFPSIVGPGYKRDMAAALGERTKIDAGNLNVTINDQGIDNEYFIGELARRESRTASYVFDDNKISHPSTKALLATATAMLAEEDEDILLVTGLPLEYFREQKEQFERFLNDFNVEITLHGSHKSIKRQITFAHSLVWPQAAGAAYDILKRRSDLITKKGSLVGVIDIGHKTTDFIVFEMGEKMSVVQALSGTIKTGISVLHNYLEQEYAIRGKGILKSTDAEQLILAGGKKLIFGKEQDFSASIKKGAEEVARHIKDAIITRWDYRIEDFPAVFLAGGGANLLHQHLTDIHPYVYVAEDTQFANVNGFMKVGELYLKKQTHG